MMDREEKTLFLAVILSIIVIITSMIVYFLL